MESCMIHMINNELNAINELNVVFLISQVKETVLKKYANDFVLINQTGLNIQQFQQNRKKMKMLIR